MEYIGEGEGEEAGSTGGLDGSALPARLPLAAPRSPVELLDTAEQEALDVLWRTAHFHD